MRTLSTLLGQYLPADIKPIVGSTPVSGIATDSRTISRGNLFFAIPGAHSDGHDFIVQVIQAGAIAVIHERELNPDIINESRMHGVVMIKVEQAREVLSYAAANWFGRPAESMTVLGVTGTDGKSSTVFFIHQLLQAAGIASGFFSTVAMQDDQAIIPNNLRQSTPEALELHEVLASFRDHGKTCAVIESTSHGLSHRTQRLRDIQFQGAVFTNLSHEHLEFHGSYAQYRDDKANLFRQLNRGRQINSPPPFGIVNRGDPEADHFIIACPTRVFTYASTLSGSSRDGKTLFADNIVGLPDSCTFDLHYNPEKVLNGGPILPGIAGSASVTIPLPGTFNIENVMAALLAAACTINCSPLDLVPLLQQIQGVKGRMVPIRQGQPFAVIVDYAHTPGAFAKILPMFRASTKGRLIAVFGSAGERDINKRPMQGELAARYCDELVLTNEDPRLENEFAIIEQIRDGAIGIRPDMPIHCIPDRAVAIETACRIAKAGDMVVLLGKGHEQSIIHPDGKHPWDEESVARQVLTDLGWQD